MDTFGRLPSSEIVTEHEVGEGGKKLTFRKHLKSSQVAYDPERKISALNFVKFVVEESVGSEAKIKFSRRKKIGGFSGSPSGHRESLVMDWLF